MEKAPQLSIVNPMSSKEAKARETKRTIIEERMRRQVEEKGRAFWKLSVLPGMKFIQEAFRRLAGKLTALERRYVEHQRKGKIDQKELLAMLDEAKASITNERFDLAEKELIAIVTHDPKNIDAYETLGRMYLSQGQYENAKEALEFLVTLVPKDASVLAALGEVFDAQHDARSAYTFYEKAKNVSPNNPKYLDFFISTAIEIGDFYEAQRAVNHLREVNPDNQKIPEFEEMIREKERSSVSYFVSLCGWCCLHLMQCFLSSKRSFRIFLFLVER